MNQQVVSGVSVSDLIEIAQGAGRKILAVKQSANLQETKKPDNSPVTAADLAASTYILEQLYSRNDLIPAISEEATTSLSVSTEKYWLIDPLDGTREFVKGSAEYTVNIALIENGQPVFGIILSPETGDLFLGGAKVAATSERQGRVQPVFCRKFDPGSPRCLISRSHKSDEESLVAALFKNLQIEGVGSSLKYTLIAAGKSDFSFRKTPTGTWDTAAAHAILKAAGGDMYGPDGKSLLYKPDVMVNPAFIAVGDPGYDWKDLIGLLPSRHERL